MLRGHIYGYYVNLWLSDSAYVSFHEYFHFRSRENTYFSFVCLLENTVKCVRTKHAGLTTLTYRK